jgi:hypothetical protein
MWLLEKYLVPPREGEGGGGGGSGNGGGGGNGTPWHQGVEPEILGHWQNKGYDLGDPKNVAIEVTKQARELQKHFGVPADQLLRLPKDASDEAGWKGVYSRLGVPAEAKDYDFAAVKRADGADLDPALSDALRASLHKARVGKDAAPEVVKAVVKSLDDSAAAAAADKTAKLNAEKAELAKLWGQNADMNRLQAMQAVKRLGVAPEVVAKLEGELGYAGVMEMFRKIGAGTSEDSFIQGDKGGGAPATMDGAKARMAELQADQAWTKRLLAGDVAARREFDTLTKQISGYVEAA